MIKKLCIFTQGFAHNRQGIIDYLDKIAPKDAKFFLFVTKECKGKFRTKRIKLFESDYNKYFSFFDLKRFCKKNKIERIVNLGSLPQEGIQMFLASFLTKTEFICYLVINPFEFLNSKVNFWSIKSFFQAVLLFPFSIFPKKILICSKDITNYCKKYLFLAKKKISQMPDTVNTKLFTPKNKILIRKKFNLPINQKIIIFVGRIEYTKGSDMLLKIAKKNPDIIFLLIGELCDGNIKKKKPKNIRIISSKTKKDLVDYYNLADLCFFPSRGEGFGLVPRESMACGTPAIVSDIMALKMIKPAIKISLDKKRINQKITNFFNLSKKEKKKLSLKSREFIINECSYEKCKSLYIDSLLKK